jgi:hypothetical protein
LEVAQWDIFGKCQLAFYRAHNMCRRKKVVGTTKCGINFYACGNGLRETFFGSSEMVSLLVSGKSKNEQHQVLPKGTR